MEQWYDSVFDHLMWAQVRLEARITVINQRANKSKQEIDERARVGRVLRRLRSTQHEMRQSFDPTEPSTRELPL